MAAAAKIPEPDASSKSLSSSISFLLYRDIARNKIDKVNRAAANATGNDIAAAPTNNRFSISSLRGSDSFRLSKNPSHLRRRPGYHFHHVANLHDFEQLLHIRLAHADTAVRNVVSNRALIVSSVNAVASVAE